MRPSRPKVLFLSILLGLAFWQPLAASPQVFFGFDQGPSLSSHPNSDSARNQFVMAVSGLGLQDFEDAGLLGPIPPGGRTIAFGGATIIGLIENLTPVFTEIRSGATTGGHPISGSQFMESFALPGPTNFYSIEFDSPVDAIGFFATDVSEYFGSPPNSVTPVQVDLISGTTVTTYDLLHTVDPSMVRPSSTLFLGIVDSANPFERIVFRNPPVTGNERIGIDDLYVRSADEDGDGVVDILDVCPGTNIPESVPTQRLGTNRWALVDGDGVFDTNSPPGGGPDLSFTIEDTAGCSCAEIIEAQGLGSGHVKFGCSISAMEDWVALVNP